ncbi:thiamine-binding protein [Streptomyces sp. SID6673]|nr:thiamine-binding protein [Streptomyces sp. SID11726]NDZ94738.1 thiamine-binding protein [Streptomyces sp. SID11726]NEB22898.1 thiamine-binding protein [Streptomyces sp. SID6673]NED63383.1 thiamine-binding protein [Streptomyces sp. SID10244]
MIVAFSLTPSGGDAVDDDGGMSMAVAAAVRVVRESGLPHQTTAMFTYLEGDWDDVMAVVKRATEAVAEHAPRVGLVLKADIRPGHTGELTGKVERVDRHLA